MIKEAHKEAAKLASAITEQVIVTDFDETLEFTDFDGSKSYNQPVINILKQWLAAGRTVVGATDGGVDKMKNALQAHFTPSEIQKIRFFDKPDMRTAFRQRDGDLDPIVPVMIFDNAPKITYLDRYDVHAYIPLKEVVALRKLDGSQEKSTYESIHDVLFKHKAVPASPSVPKLLGSTL